MGDLLKILFRNLQDRSGCSKCYQSGSSLSILLFSNT